MTAVLCLGLAASLWGTGTAIGQDTSDDRPVVEIATVRRGDSLVRVQTTTTIVFQLSQCDGVRARFLEDDEHQTPGGERLIVTLYNQTDTLCVYKGVALQGYLKGRFTTRVDDETQELYLPPGGRLSLKIAPEDVDAPRGGVELQIAPGRGVILLKGLPPEPAQDPLAPYGPPLSSQVR